MWNRRFEITYGDACILAVLLVIFICVFVVVMNRRVGSLLRHQEVVLTANFQAEAVDRGHARYYLDENGVERWEWLPSVSVIRGSGD